MKAFFVRFRRVLAGASWMTLLIVSTPGLEAATLGSSDCEVSATLDLNGQLRTVGEKRGGRTTTFFDVEVPSAGLLALEVLTPLDSATEPKVALFDEACRRAGDRGRHHVLIKRWGSGQLVGVRSAGTLRFGVAAQDPGRDLGEFKVLTRFVSRDRLANKSVEEPDPDPDPIGGSVEEPDPDPEPIGGNKSVEEPDPDPEPIGGGAAVCDGGAPDDHDDLFVCPTSLQAGTVTSGRLEGPWGDDSDVFTFTLARARTVLLETRGETDTLGALYDARGHRLAVDDDGSGGPGFRLVKTLAPGRYSIRVAGAGGARGEYALTLELMDW